jgi:hypothetical protein
VEVVMVAAWVEALVAVVRTEVLMVETAVTRVAAARGIWAVVKAVVERVGGWAAAWVEVLLAVGSTEVLMVVQRAVGIWAVVRAVVERGAGWAAAWVDSLPNCPNCWHRQSGSWCSSLNCCSPCLAQS